jgi:hypothetical protein
MHRVAKSIIEGHNQSVYVLITVLQSHLASKGRSANNISFGSPIIDVAKEEVSYELTNFPTLSDVEQHDILMLTNRRHCSSCSFDPRYPCAPMWTRTLTGSHQHMPVMRITKRIRVPYLKKDIFVMVLLLILILAVLYGVRIIFSFLHDLLHNADLEWLPWRL